MTPTPKQLKKLQDSLGLTQTQMAELAGYPPSKQTKEGKPVPDGAKWRKLTAPEGGASHRGISTQTFFLLAAHLALTESELARIYAKQKEILDL